MFIATFFEHKEELPEKLSSFGFGFLIPIFFIYVGTTLDLDSILSQSVIIKIVTIMLFMIFMRLVAAIAVYYKELGLKRSVLFAFGHSMPLTFLIAIASIGLQTDSISKEDYYAFIAAATIQALLMMVVIKALCRNRDKKSLFLSNER